MAEEIHTSRSQLDRLLDLDNVSVSLETMARAAQALGKLSTVSVAAVANAVDADGLGIRVGEANAPVSDTEPIFGWTDPLEPPNVAGVG